MTITKTLLFIASVASGVALAQQAPSNTGEYYRDYQPEAIIRELKRDAVSDDAIMIPMRDGVGLDTDVYRPKNAKGPLPTIFWKTPYNELEMKSGPALNYALAAVRRGYAFVVQNERGRYFSQGDWQILGQPPTAGYDTLTWIAKQAWSNGKVGPRGCSQSAEGVGPRRGPSPRPGGHGAHVGRCRYRQGRPLSGTGQLVHWRCAAKSLLRLALRRR